MKFALVDLDIPGRKANRDHTGGFGSQMGAEGASGWIVGKLKQRLIELPVLCFGFTRAILRQAGHEATYYRGPTNGEDIIIIASSLHCYDEEVAFAKRERIKHPKSKIGFVGPFVKTNPEIFEEAADFLIFGELESTIFNFLDGKCEFSGKLNHGIVTDMERLPTPDWRGVDISQLSYFPLLHKRPFLTIQSSRGCSFDCDFCPYMVSQTKKYRRRKPEQVVEEIIVQQHRHGIRSMLFRDIVFTIHKKHVQQICQLMLENNVKLEWGCETRVDCLDEELLDQMHEAGCRGINLGIETGDIDILKMSGKKPPVLKEQENRIRYMHKKGIRVNAFYMLGLVGDTPKSMQNTIDYAKSLNTLGAQFCTMTPFPGTILYDRYKDALITKDFTKFNEYQPVVDIKTSTPEEVIAYASKAYRYYLRPQWLLPYGVKTSFRLLRNLAAV